MKATPATSLKAHRCRRASTSCIMWLLLLGYSSLLVVLASASASKESAQKNDAGDSEAGPSFSGNLHEYRRVGSELIGLWREYTAMSDALSHALRDYNVAVRQEQRAELALVLAHKQQEAESSIAQRKAIKGHVAPTLLYGELASLKELKRQMKRLDRKVGEIPDYRYPEENVLLVQGSTVPVNISKALSRSSATLFHKAIKSYHMHIKIFNKKYQALRSFLYEIKMNSGGSNRRKLIRQAVELGNFFDTEAPIALHFQMKK